MSKIIPGFENYRIYEDGTVVNIKKGKRIAPSVDTDGYLKFSISNNGERKCFRVHRILSILYIDNPLCHPCVNHKDGNKLNNSLANLEWCTHLQNINHAQKIGLAAIGEKRTSAKLSNSDVLSIVNIYRSGEKIKNIAKFYGVSEQSIKHIFSGKNWRHITGIKKQF